MIELIEKDEDRLTVKVSLKTEDLKGLYDMLCDLGDYYYHRCDEYRGYPDMQKRWKELLNCTHELVGDISNMPIWEK